MRQLVLGRGEPSDLAERLGIAAQEHLVHDLGPLHRCGCEAAHEEHEARGADGPAAEKRPRVAADPGLELGEYRRGHERRDAVENNADRAGVTVL
jgi:hypothetical protein